MKSRSLSENLGHEFFYVAPDKISNSRVLFGPNESRHIVRVLRHRKGDHIYASDGQGSFYHLRLVSATHRRVEAKIIEHQKIEPGIRFTLSVAMLKGKRMDYVVEKSTELGISKIIPMLTENSVVKHLGRSRRIRLERIAVAAMKQSRGPWLPEIFDVTSFEQLVDESQNYDLTLIAHPSGKWLPNQELRLPSSVMIMVGPEGGFSDEEILMAKDSGIEILNLGPRRLRSDTAAVVSLAKVTALFERR